MASQRAFPPGAVRHPCLRSLPRGPVPAPALAPSRGGPPDRSPSPAPAASADAALVLVEEDQRHYREVNDRSASRAGLDSPCPADFYELLGIDLDADNDAIRSAYRSLQRIAHPDVAGDAATGLSILLNHAYKTLTNEGARAAYDAAVRAFRERVGSFTGMPVSAWLGPPGEQRALFVDETTCIGCRNCTCTAPNTFFMEDDYGRARVSHQWGDDEEVLREAMDMCPVNCIHFVRRKQLALLEFVMKGCKREDIAIVARRRSGNMGIAPASNDPFTRAEVFLRRRERAKSAEEMTGEDAGRARSEQDEELSATIASAWLAVDPELRAKGWPSWEQAAAEAKT